jgi:hypothetical protein
MNMAEPFAETLEPRRKRSLIGWWLLVVTFFARVVGHAFDAARFQAKARSSAAPRPRGPY